MMSFLRMQFGKPNPRQLTDQERAEEDAFNEELAIRQAERDAKAKKQERTRNLCVLVAGQMQALSLAGLHDMARGESAIEAAELMLDRIERGPLEPDKDEMQGLLARGLLNPNEVKWQEL